jgi:hypothetical protein
MEPALFAVKLRCSDDRAVMIARSGADMEMSISGLMTFELQNHDNKITERIELIRRSYDRAGKCLPSHRDCNTSVTH